MFFFLFVQNMSLCAQHSSRLVHKLIFHMTSSYSSFFFFGIILFSNEKKVHSQSHLPSVLSSRSRAHRAAPGSPGEARFACSYYRQLLKLLRFTRQKKSVYNLLSIFFFFRIFYVCYVLCVSASDVQSEKYSLDFAKGISRYGEPRRSRRRALDPRGRNRSLRRAVLLPAPCEFVISKEDRLTRVCVLAFFARQ